MKNAKCNNKEQNDIDSQLKWHTTKVRPWNDFFLGFQPSLTNAFIFISNISFLLYTCDRIIRVFPIFIGNDTQIKYQN